MTRYGDVPIIFTRLGLAIDHLIEVSKKYPSTFTRAQFVEVTNLKPTSTADKLRDMELYGLIRRNNAIYTISESGKKIIVGSPERSSEILAAINKIPLWAHLIKTIGKNPDRNTFDKSIKGFGHYGNLSIETLDQLWYAFTDDLSCITKSPPFSKWSSMVRKSATSHPRIPGPSINHTVQQKKEMIVIPEPAVKTQNTESTIQNAEEEEKIEKTESHKSTPNYGVIEYKGHQFEINDDLSYGFAEQIMKKIKKDLENKGVEFES